MLQFIIIIDLVPLGRGEDGGTLEVLYRYDNREIVEYMIGD